ncbi:transporter substrate-binding domain-containing protein [Clostridium botulinum]|uniref:ABC transporter substrate-binding protein n=1 Tax=Clostridium botulinum TaxID=1491 RepID=UPI000773AEF8|nr:ABC transporter substrate-binding protein [Clostridium botulinum]NFE85004.1 transporter substrate-binding domain-containing protein [Clostridium botulinum]NFG38109.1 transporter substrate-binding domain-containing protein [Clostridium botulinum]NFI51477.1 transporter substrate-binding domain-containing protein [Clostridium botulinum]NFN29989.1 transporter substrate-binding domain-containing protein [Clostridium botulinum]NFN46862.1 transporter substrate-binding domain-containing protein [Cl
MNKGLLKKLGLIVAIGAMAISIVGCSGNKNEAGSKDGKETASVLESIKQKGKLVVGTSADYPPYEFHKEVGGKDQIVGFDISIAKSLAEDLGVELQINDMDFDGLLIALQAGKVDMVFAGMTPTDERKQNAEFSDIYYTAQHGFIVRKGEEGNIKSIDDLKDKKIGVQKGSIQEKLANEKIPDAEKKALGKVTDLVLDLKNNKVDAILVELPVAEFNCEKNSDIALTNVVLEDSEGGSAIAMSKGSDDLKGEINKTIQKLKDEGKIDKFVIEANEMVE